MDEKYLYMCDKGEYGNSIIVRKKDKIVCKTFANFSKNWFDIPQHKYYWFSMLIFENFSFNEIIYSNRTEYYIDGEIITDINILTANLYDINKYIFAYMKNLQTFVETELEYMYFDTMN